MVARDQWGLIRMVVGSVSGGFSYCTAYPRAANNQAAISKIGTSAARKTRAAIHSVHSTSFLIQLCMSVRTSSPLPESRRQCPQAVNPRDCVQMDGLDGARNDEPKAVAWVWKRCSYSLQNSITSLAVRSKRKPATGISSLVSISMYPPWLS